MGSSGAARLVVVAGLMGLPSALSAQGAAECEGHPVASVHVETTRPEFRGMLAWWRQAARAVGLHHANTAPGLVRRFVTLEPGRRCTEFRRSESERILRSQPYIADATVFTRRSGDSVSVFVQTVDEVPVVAGARMRGITPRAFNLGTMNLWGAGVHLEGRWEDGGPLRTGYGGKIGHPQLLGRPYQGVVEGMRRPLGEYYAVSLSHPFFTDLQRIAWHSGYWVSKDFAPLRRRGWDKTYLVQPVDRAMWHVGGVLRFGPPRRLGLIGGMLLDDQLTTRDVASLVDSTGHLRPTKDTAGVRQYPEHRARYVAGVLGLRALTFTRMRGLDALEADQDVAAGTQIAATLGVRPSFDRPFDRSFAALDVYAGARGARSLVGIRMDAESRMNLGSSDWAHLAGSGRAAWYYKPRPRWTSELSVEGAGVWRSMVPLQLELGDRRTGVRGYAASREPGARRLIARLEQRFDLMRYRSTRAAVGAAAFSDAGRVWKGDAPFGETSPVRTSAGVALLAAVPARSKRTMRVEVAVPFHRATGARPELRFTVREPARGFWTEPPRLRWARLSAVPEQVFSWP